MIVIRDINDKLNGNAQYLRIDDNGVEWTNIIGDINVIIMIL